MAYTLKLVDFITNSTFGTCELCMYSGVHTDETFVFTTSEGNTIYLENGELDWGDFYPFVHIENSVDFAAWLSTQTFEGRAPVTETDMKYVLPGIVSDYELHR